MRSLFLRPHLLALAATLSTAALAAPDASHPAVARALAHLQGADVAARAGTSGHTFNVRDVIVDADGSEHVRLGRDYLGLRVIGGDLVVHSAANGTLKAISETLRSAPALSVTPTLLADAASGAALTAMGDDATTEARSQSLAAERVIYARGAKPQLAWAVTVPSRHLGMEANEIVIIDAHRGKVLDRWSDTQTYDAPMTGKTQYSGNVPLRGDKQADGSYVLRDLTRGGHKTVDLNGGQLGSNGGTLVTSATATYGNGKHSKKTANLTDAADATYGHAMTWDYYLNVLGRNGIANDGVGATSKVHGGTGPFGLFYNASWSDSCFCMSYSKMKDRSNPGLLGLDVAGHEMTHGVTSRTAGLIYSQESGALNESISDMMGNMVEAYANNPADPADGDIGEQMFPTDPLRRMYQPNLDGASADCYYPGVGSLDVHYSSGVGNHFFYLLWQGSAPAGGKTSPSCSAGDTKKATGGVVNLAGIGANAAAKIVYRALSVYMTSNTNYAAARVATLNAANDLYGSGSTQANAVAAAWSAVGVN